VTAQIRASAIAAEYAEIAEKKRAISSWLMAVSGKLIAHLRVLCDLCGESCEDL
jgi:hypothetical protein